MSRDPILHALGLRVRRTLLFLWLALMMGLGLWGWVLLGWDGLGASALWTVTRAVLATGAQYPVWALILHGCGVIGVLATAVLYLVAALWWRKRGDVHRRGARFIDRREE